MYIGLDNMDLSYSHIRKTAVVDKIELSLLNMDILALRETRIAGNGSLKEKNHTFFSGVFEEKSPEASQRRKCPTVFHYCGRC